MTKISLVTDECFSKKKKIPIRDILDLKEQQLYSQFVILPPRKET